MDAPSEEGFREIPKIVSVVLAVSALCVPAAVPATTYETDSNHSTIAFAVRHILINTVRGKFKELSGVIQLEESDFTKSAVTVKILAATIDTGSLWRDDDLRGRTFSKWPNSRKSPS